MRPDLHRWVVFQITYMRSKSESVTALYRINRDATVENEIFMDNTPDQTAYNTEIQRVVNLERMYVRTTD